MKFHIFIYWCQMNYYDSARIKSVLENLGFEYSQNSKDADIIIFDTCSVRQKSEDKIFGKLKEIPKEKKIWITWCMPAHNLKLDKWKKGNFLKNIENKQHPIFWIEKPQEIKKITKGIHINYSFDPLFSKIKKNFENLELIFRIDDLEFLPRILKELNYKIDKELNHKKFSSLSSDNANQIFQESSQTAFLPIQTGCNQFCSYCIVPYARGLENNFSKEEIFQKIDSYLEKGKKEIMLLWQIVNKHPQFSEILEELLEKKSIKRLRYTSPYPNFYNKKIFELHQKYKNLCPHIHIPLQSGSDKILKKMKRWYNSRQFKDFIDNINNLKRNISITTDVIVGFPDETEEDFQKTLDMIEYGRFDMIYMGIYSPRPGTYAYKKYKDNINLDTKKKRWDILNQLLQKISFENNQKEIGKQKNVMITQINEELAIWYDEKLKNVLIDFKGKEKIKVWNFAKVKITEWKDLKLRGFLCS